MTTRKRTASARLRSAQADVVAARAALDHAASPWRAVARRHRSALIIGGGFVGGLAAGALPRSAWRTLRSGVAIATTALAKSVLMPLIAGTLFARRHSDAEETQATSGEAN
jgi:hypothetical protein